MRNAVVAALSGIVLAGCMDAQASTDLRAPQPDVVTSAPASLMARAKLVSDKFGASNRFFELAVTRGEMKRGDADYMASCRALEVETRTAAALNAITLQQQDEIYSCAGALS